MKKFGKKLMVMVLVLAMVATCFAGCGEKEVANEFIIGGSGPLTGPAASYGISVKQGAETAVEEINAAGGINGYKIDYRPRDDEHSNDKVKTVVETLIDDGMHVFMGATTSGPTVVAGSITSDENIFQISPSGSSLPCTEYDNAFRVCFTDPVQGAKSAKYLTDYLPEVKKVGVLYDSSVDYSTGIYKAFEEAADPLIELVVQTFITESSTDFNTQIRKFKEEGVEAVFVPFYAAEAANFLTQAKMAGLSVPFFGCDGMDGIDGIMTDVDAMEGLVYLSGFVYSSEEANAKAFTEKYNKKYGKNPDQFAAAGYDAMYAIKAGMEKGECTPAMSPSDICDIMMKTMTEVTVKGLTGTMTWTADGETNKDAQFAVMKNGKQEALTK